MSVIRAFTTAVRRDFLLISSNYFQQLVSLGYGVLIAKQLSPEAYGLFGLAVLINTYLKFLNFGAQFTINNRLSLRLNSRAAFDYLNFNILLYPILTGVFLLVSYYFKFFEPLQNDFIYIWLFLIFDNIYQLLQGVLRAQDQTRILAISKYFIGFSVLILLWIFIDWNHSNNPFPLFSKLVLMPLIGIIYFSTLPEVRKLISIPKFNFKNSYGYFIIEGLSLGIYVFLQDFLNSIDRLFIAGFFEQADLGIYTFAFNLALGLQIVITTIMFMDHSRYFKEFNNIKKPNFVKLQRDIYKKIFPLYFILLTIGGLLIYLLLHFYLREYKTSFASFLILMITYIPTILAFPYSVHLMSNNKSKLLVWAALIGIFSSLTFNYIIIYLGYDYLYIIGVTLISKYFIFLLLKKYSFKIYD